jgi:hypothetical protein
MGFANLLSAEIAADHSVLVEKVFALWNQQQNCQYTPKNRFGKDAKAIISHILSETYPKVTRNSKSDT